MKKRKWISIMMCVVMATTLLGGCGNTQEDGNTSAPASQPQQSSDDKQDVQDNTPAVDSENQVTLKWALWDLNSVPYYQPLVDAFEKEHTNIKIEMVDLGTSGSSDYMTNLGTELSGTGSEFDLVCVQDIPGYASLVSRGVLEPLDSYISKDGVSLEGYGGTTDQLTIDGALYELPFRSDFWVLFYNSDVFDAANMAYPTNDMTWTDYDNMARAIADTTPGQEIYGSHYHTWRSCVQCLALLEGEHTMVDGEYDFLRPYYEMVVSQQQDGICRNYAELKTTNLHHSDAFAQGNLAMYVMGTWNFPGLIDRIASGEYTEIDNWHIAKIPHADGIEAGTTIATLTAIAIPAVSDSKDEAWEFVKFMTGAEGAEIIASTGGIPALMTDEVVNVLAAMDGFPKDEQSKEALKTAAAYLEMPVHEKTSEINTVLNEVHDAIMTGAMSIDEGIADANKRVGEILGK